MKRLYIILATILMVAKVFAFEKTSINITVNGIPRDMVVFTPSVPQENMPLMIVTHGMNQTPEYQYDTDKMYLMVDTAKFVIAYLRSIGTTWDINGTIDQAFVEKSITEMKKRYGIDRHRVYWSGFSMGSMLMYHCMQNMQGKIAAFAPTSGIHFMGKPWEKCQRPVNLIHCHAYADDVFNYEQFHIHDYVANMAQMNKSKEYLTFEKYNPGGTYDGLKEVWKTEDGHEVELYVHNDGGHCPQQANGWEIWRFCQRFSLSDAELDPEESEENIQYVIDETKETKDDASDLDGKILLATDVSGQYIWYANHKFDSPQNIRNGHIAEVGNNQFCYLKFNKVNDPGCTIAGTAYTIQIVDKDGHSYSVFGNEGYLNSPNDTWCIFTLGLGDQYGEDAAYFALWEICRVSDGYIITNVGARQTGAERMYIYPTSPAPQQEKGYTRLFTQVGQKSIE